MKLLIIALFSTLCGITYCKRKYRFTLYLFNLQGKTKLVLNKTGRWIVGGGKKRLAVQYV